MKEIHKRIRNITLSVIGIIFCVLFGLILFFNLTIMVKSIVKPNEVPYIFNITPLAIISGSMSGDKPDHIEVGDLIIVKKTDPKSLKKGDVISFKQDESIVTHRIIKVNRDDKGKPEFITKGDANNSEDEKPVKMSDVVGSVQFRIPFLGDVALFLKRPVGMLIFIGVLVVIFGVYQIIHRRKVHNREKSLEAEVERLKQLTQTSTDKDLCEK